jgi:hypothetical protein
VAEIRTLSTPAAIEAASAALAEDGRGLLLKRVNVVVLGRLVDGSEVEIECIWDGADRGYEVHTG